jgi:hypothetical protein
MVVASWLLVLGREIEATMEVISRHEFFDLRDRNPCHLVPHSFFLQMESVVMRDPSSDKVVRSPSRMFIEIRFEEWVKLSNRKYNNKNVEAV